MSPRGTPPVAPTDLRDHADDERVGRIWHRIANDLVARRNRTPRGSSGLAAALLAAAIAAFGGGLLVGRSVWLEPPASLAPTASPDSGFEVFAAGSQERIFPLPGGGELTLRPGATVEVEGSDGEALTLRLVQGDATLDAQARASGFTIVVGDAQLASAGGGVLRVWRHADTMDVEVTSGSASLTSPAGNRDIPAGERVESVPLHMAAISTTKAAPHVRAHARSALPVEGVPPGEAAPATAAPHDWHAAYQANDFAGALELLLGRPGGIRGAIASAKDAKELSQIADLASQGGDVDGRIAALTKAAESSPGTHDASLAAIQLGDIYLRLGQPAKADQYFQLAQSNPHFADDAACRQVKAASRGVNKLEAARLSKEYLAKHPAGQCRDLAERMAKGDDIASDEPP